MSKYIQAGILVLVVGSAIGIRIATFGYLLLLVGLPLLGLSIFHIVNSLRATQKEYNVRTWSIGISHLLFFMIFVFQLDGGNSGTSSVLAAAIGFDISFACDFGWYISGVSLALYYLAAISVYFIPPNKEVFDFGMTIPVIFLALTLAFVFYQAIALRNIVTLNSAGLCL